MKYVLIAALFLSACSTAPVRLLAPNGRVVQCGPYETFFNGHEAAAVMLERGCIDDYQRQGFVRIP